MRRRANAWDRFYRYHEAPWRGERPVADLLPVLGTGRVLELGCGNGKLLRPLVAAGMDVVALDISWHALRRLDHQARVLADAAFLPFDEGAFSAVLDIHCTGHLGVEGRRRAAAEAFRVLQPGGHWVVERLTPDDLRASQGSEVEGQPGMRRLADGRVTHFTDDGELRRVALEAGFEEVELARQRRTPRLGAQRVVRETLRGVFRRR